MRDGERRASEPRPSVRAGASTECSLELVSSSVEYGRVESLRQLGLHFLNQHLNSEADAYRDARTRLDRLSRSFEEFNAYCDPEQNQEFTYEGIGRLQVCKFPTWGASMPFFYRDWVLVGKVNDVLSWMHLYREGPSTNTTNKDITLRRLSLLSEEPPTFWLEIQEEITRVEGRGMPETVRMKVERNWYASVIEIDTRHSLDPLAYRIPVRKSLHVGHGPRPDTLTQKSETQIDVRFPSSGKMQVTARTDSLSEEQRCWLGTHVIDSTLVER